MNLEQSRPSCIVAFYTELGKLVARATNDPGSALDNDIISVSTSRVIGADAPIFSINLVARKAWDKWVRSNDLIYIEMCRPPQSKEIVFVGLVS